MLPPFYTKYSSIRIAQGKSLTYLTFPLDRFFSILTFRVHFNQRGTA
jgi:hypothetical protein